MKALVIAGATVFVIPYLASALVATTSYDSDDSDSSQRGALWVPAVGPFIALGDNNTAFESGLLVLDGLAQVGGLAMFVYGLVSPAAPSTPKEPVGRLTISVRPLTARGAPGAAVVGTF